MTPELFSKAKGHFLRLIELGKEKQARELALLLQDDPELAREVRSLIDNHISKTIIKNSDVTTYGSDESTFGRTATLALQQVRSKLLGGFFPIITAICASAFLALLGWGLQSILQSQLAATTSSQLETVLDLEQRLLDQWKQAASLKVESWVRSTTVRNAVAELVAVSKDSSLNSNELREKLMNSPAQELLEKEINALSGIPWVQANPAESGQRYAVWSRDGTTLTDWNRRAFPSAVGQGASPEGAAKLNRVFQTAPGNAHATFVYLPRAMDDNRITAEYPMEAKRLQVQVITAVHDDNGVPIAALMIRDQRIADDFEAAMRSGRFDATGECYLMDVDGWMINEPRSIERMKDFDFFGEYSRKSDNRYIVRVADPGGDVFAGHKPDAPVKQWVRTKAARAALDKQSGMDIQGYRDFAGRAVVGAWRWDEVLHAAIMVEQTKKEAFQTLDIVHRVNRIAWGIPLLIALALAAISGLRARLRYGKPPLQIGAYKVSSKLGEGGLGIVYKGQHRLLGRLAAIKLLKVQSTNPQLAKRFEREVRMASKLVHPNAISIFDYGLTDGGAFYYAMEYIPGVNLSELMMYNKSISLSRTLHMLVQICGAIREAHLAGMVHRDIKPQNIMVCYRAGIADVIKVLDYGLVKSFVDHTPGDTTVTSVLIGTPKFMAPERLETPWLADPKIDIYSIGTVAYYLLTGHTPAPGITPNAILEAMASEQSPYRELVGQKAFQELVRLIGFCISAEPSLRPGSVGAIVDVLQKIQESYPWQQASAEAWWIEHEANLMEFTANLREGKPTGIPSNHPSNDPAENPIGHKADHLEKV
jgi:eukaryotic-like serine/threonine-protein kinase